MDEKSMAKADFITSIILTAFGHFSLHDGFTDADSRGQGPRALTPLPGSFPASSRR